MVRLRLQRKGRKKAPFYHIVAADSRAKRDGRYIERIGSYNPMTSPATISIDRDKAFEWLKKGAQPSDTVRAILRFKGVLYRKHLMRGVAKGVMTEEQAMVKYQEWIDTKDAKLADRVEASKQARADYHKKLSGTRPVVEEVVEETVEEVVDAAEEVVDAVEEKVEEAKDEAPAEDENKEG